MVMMGDARGLRGKFCSVRDGEVEVAWRGRISAKLKMRRWIRVSPEATIVHHEYTKEPIKASTISSNTL